MSKLGPVLLAEDDENDVFLMRSAFQKAAVPNALQVVCNGAEAMDYLAGHGVYGDRHAYPFPCLLITDIKMPKVNGFELLDWLQHQPQEELKQLPAIALSSSCHESDLKRALELGARAYVMKPQDYNSLVEWVRGLKTTWLMPHEQEGAALGGFKATPSDRGTQF